MFCSLKTQVSYIFGIVKISTVDLRRKMNMFILPFKSQYLEFKPVGAYLKVVVVGGKFEGANLDIFAFVLFLVIEMACECLTSKMKNLFYPSPLLKCK